MEEKQSDATQILDRVNAAISNVPKKRETTTTHTERVGQKNQRQLRAVKKNPKTRHHLRRSGWRFHSLSEPDSLIISRPNHKMEKLGFIQTCRDESKIYLDQHDIKTKSEDETNWSWSKPIIRRFGPVAKKKKKRTKVRKAEGPGGICFRRLRDCAYQLCQVALHIFNLSLERILHGPLATLPQTAICEAPWLCLRW